MFPYLFVLGTVLFTVYGQIAIKWQVAGIGTVPTEGFERYKFLVLFLLNPWVVSGYVAAFLASLSWMVAVRDLPLSVAYPFTALSFVLILIASAVMFHESISAYKIAGVVLILAGIVVGSRS